MVATLQNFQSPSTFAVPQEKSTIHVPLSQLVLSPTNVRRVEPTGISELAQMIVSQGLLNPLIVTTLVGQDDQPQYGVEAGGRRLRALQMLAQDGLIAQDWLIECKLISSDLAIEVSLTENISQEGMHPADEFDAYQALSLKGLSVAAIANKFGVTELNVQRRLKMSSVASELFDLYRQNEMTLDQLMVLAATDDKALQVRVWNSLPVHSRNVYYLKKQLFQDEVSAKDQRLNVVSIEEYKAAGGGVRVDLFSEHGEEMIEDPTILDELISKKLEQRKQELLTEGWGWVEVSAEPVYGYNISSKYQQDRPAKRAATEAEEARLNAMCAELDALNTKLADLTETDEEEEDQSQVDSLNEKIAALDEAYDALEATLIDTSYPDKANQGVIVFASRDGIDYHYGLRTKAQAASAGLAASGDASKGKGEFSERLMLNMTSHLTAALQASMIANQKVALAAAAHRFAVILLEDRSMHNNPVQISLTTPKYEMEKNSDSLASNKGYEKTQKALDRWHQMLPDDKALWLDWFIDQPQGATLEMIALGAALSTTAVHGSKGADQSNAKGLIKAVGLDMADFWEPTAETYLNHIPKGKLIEAVTQATNPAESEPMAKMKKGEAIVYAASKLVGKRWLPSALKS